MNAKQDAEPVAFGRYIVVSSSRLDQSQPNRTAKICNFPLPTGRRTAPPTSCTSRNLSTGALTLLTLGNARPGSQPRRRTLTSRPLRQPRERWLRRLPTICSLRTRSQVGGRLSPRYCDRCANASLSPPGHGLRRGPDDGDRTRASPLRDPCVRPLRREHGCLGCDETRNGQNWIFRSRELYNGRLALASTNESGDEMLRRQPAPVPFRRWRTRLAFSSRATNMVAADTDDIDDVTSRTLPRRSRTREHSRRRNQ